MLSLSLPRFAQGVVRRRVVQQATMVTSRSSFQLRGIGHRPSFAGLRSMAKETAIRSPRSIGKPGGDILRSRPGGEWTTTTPSTVPVRESFLSGVRVSSTASLAFLSSTVAATATATAASALHTAKRFHHTAGLTSPSRAFLSPKQQGGESGVGDGSTGGKTDNALQGVRSVDRYREEQEEEQREERKDEEDPFNRSSGPGYLPFPPPFHTVNVIMILFIANILCYVLMAFGSDDLRDFIVEHFTLSHENFHKIYPIFTNALYQENLLQLLIDCWLLWQFGDTMLAFLGNVRLTFFCFLCTLGGSLIHVARQKFELYYGMDTLEVRGRCYGPNPMIMGLISMEGLIFRHLNFIQQPPIPFLILTAFVMVIDVWRIFTTRPEEHGASTGGALMAYLFWALPTRFLGLDKLTATM